MSEDVIFRLSNWLLNSLVNEGEEYFFSTHKQTINHSNNLKKNPTNSEIRGFRWTVTM